jgi:hypothetical protein
MLRSTAIILLGMLSIESMPRRITAVPKAKGGYTKYYGNPRHSSLIHAQETNVSERTKMSSAPLSKLKWTMTFTPRSHESSSTIAQRVDNLMVPQTHAMSLPQVFRCANTSGRPCTLSKFKARAKCCSMSVYT